MDSEHDRLIFFGREQESKLLFHKILSNKLLVMFAKSGIGKTSLLNIGVSHPLRDHDFIPLSIRLNDPKQPLLDAVYAKIDDIAEQQQLDFHAGDKSRLWHYFNTVEFWSSEDKLLTPVLIFDQFEELFTLHSPQARQSFITQLAELTKNKIPKAIKQSSSDSQLPNVKIVIAIREDYLAFLDELSREIPEILHNRFRLQPLNRQSAQHAIEAPAALESPLISTPTFSYHLDAVTQMLDFLCMRHERGKVIATDEVESFQLQLLCGHLEELVEKKTGERIIEAADLGGEEGMRQELKLFYERQVSSFNLFSTRRKVRKLCEKGLISSKHNRLSLAQEEIEKDFQLSAESLNVLVKTRLLRTEPRLGSVHYELSHDTLVKPIMEAKRKRKNRTTLLAGVFSFLLGSTMLAAATYTYFEEFYETEIEQLYSQLKGQLNPLNFDKAHQTHQQIIAIDANSAKS
ncbi:MAG: hypothetical protein MJK04_33055, partial [Psychrosphaera sp.]|nr:hypothetical protein [Psychrosphaera sp.]